MNYKLERYEKYKDIEGNITSIFIAVRIDDELGNSLVYEKWLNKDEINLILENEDNFVSILERAIAEGIVKLEEKILKQEQVEIESNNEKIISNVKIDNINLEVEKIKNSNNNNDSDDVNINIDNEIKEL